MSSAGRPNRCVAAFGNTACRHEATILLNSISSFKTIEVFCDKLERESLWFCGCTQTPQIVLSSFLLGQWLSWGKTEATPLAPFLF